MKDFFKLMIKILVYSYYHQENACSMRLNIYYFFHVSSGVKQSGILSPMLFNVYMDKLSIRYNGSGIRGDIGCYLINRLCYCLITLSSFGIESLLRES